MSSTSSSRQVDNSALDSEASQLVLNALERTSSRVSEQPSTKAGSFSRMSLSSMIGALTLSRNSNDSDRVGRSRVKDKLASKRSSSAATTTTGASSKGTTSEPPSRSQSRARSQSPFTLRRFRSREREPSPTPEPLPLGTDTPDPESGDERSTLSGGTSGSRFRPRTTAFERDDDSETEGPYTEDEGDESEWSGDEDLVFDPLTERNTEANAQAPDGPAPDPELEAAAEPDPLGEGVNVVVPPEPYFPSTLNYATRTGVGRKGSKGSTRRKKRHEPLPSTTSSPLFQRDRCTIVVTQGSPEEFAPSGRRQRRYVVASDLSEESRYAVEWGIGTVLRDGDEMIIVTVVENENKVDPSNASSIDKTTKLRAQQERQGLAYILVRQANSLLQRTKLNVTLSCQAWHAKNARHMLLDIVDFYEPTMLIVGSRGLGQLKGILLGSTSHYLIQRCSVPVMVARRRLKRPAKRSAHLTKNRPHVSLAEAAIDTVAARVDQDVATMRDEIQRDDNRRDDDRRAVVEEAEVEEEEEAAEDMPGVKVAGE